MTTPPPASKSITPTSTGPRAAPQAVDSTAVGEPKGAAEGVRTALRPDPHTDGRYIAAMLCIRAPNGATPSATSQCLCGWHRRAFGERRVLALIADHTAHRDACPLRTPQEGRTAA